MKLRLKRTLLLHLAALIAVTTGLAQDRETAGERYLAIVKEYEEVGGAEQFASQFLDYAQRYRDEPESIDALIWVLRKRKAKPEADQAIEMLMKDHLKRTGLEEVCQRVGRTPSLRSEPFLRAVTNKNPDANVRAHANYWLSYLLENQAKVVTQLKESPELASRVLQYYGKDYGRALAEMSTPDLQEKLESVYQQMLKSHSNTKVGRQQLGELAEQSLFRIRFLSVGRTVPEIEGEDIAGNRFKLSDFRGKVVLLSFWAHW